MAFSFLASMKRFKSDATNEFYSCVGNLLEEKQVQQLDAYRQHYCYTRLQHSLDVAYYSFLVAKLLGWDSKSTARGGLLHDLFLYDWRTKDITGGHHASTHPLIALENARNLCELNPIEEDIIKKHMWLVTPVPPRYKEGFIVTFVDKYCAAKECVISLFTRKSAIRAVYMTRA